MSFLKQASSAYTSDDIFELEAGRAGTCCSRAAGSYSCRTEIAPERAGRLVVSWKRGR